MHHHRPARAAQRALCPRRFPRPDRSCGKRRFVDRIAADLALTLIRSQGRALGSEPVRSHPCPQCDGWRLTCVRWWRAPTSAAGATTARR